MTTGQLDDDEEEEEEEECTYTYRRNFVDSDELCARDVVTITTELGYEFATSQSSFRNYYYYYYYC